MTQHRRLRSFAGRLIVALACVVIAGSSVVAQAPPKSVLVLYAARRDGMAPAIADRMFQRVLGEGLDVHLDYNAEYLDLARFSDPSYRNATRQFLREKYEGLRFDLLISIGDAAFDFAWKFRDDVLSGSPPLVFSTSTPPVVPQNATGVITPLTLRATLDVALSLHPDTQRVIVIGGASPLDRANETAAKNAFKPLEGSVSFTYLHGQPMPEILKQAAALPPRSIVFLLTLIEDGKGDRYPTAETVARLSATSTAPVYTWTASLMGEGSVGGRMTSMDVLTARLAELGLRVLRGESAEAIPVREIDWTVTQFDWRQLQRWGVSEARLPPGSEILFRPPSAWAQYREYIIVGGALVITQAAFIGALLFQRRRRRRAEVSLRESEERFRLMADTAPVLIWRSGTDKRCDFFNRPWLEFTGRTLDQELGDGWTLGLHPDDYDRCMSVYTTAFDARQPIRMECRLQRADGEYRWMLDIGVPRYEADGVFAGYIGSCVDIHDRKRAEDGLRESEHRLQNLAGRLISAQEDERARIARELHDDVNQRLAGLAITLSALAHRASTLLDDHGLPRDLSALRERTTDLTKDVRSLSRDLHPAVLQHSGLVAAIAAHCREVEAAHDLDVAFTSDGDFEDTDSGSALCLFRVVQEALRNVVNHADARHVEVRLGRDDDHATIDVTDNGRGFDVSLTRTPTGGLGLISIRERARLAGGTVSVSSERNKGTHISVRIPIAAPTPPSRPAVTTDLGLSRTARRH